MLISDVVTRLNEAAPLLGGRIELAAKFTQLIKDNALPQITPAAFVVPAGFSARPNRLMSGLHAQQLSPRFNVIIAINYAADVTGSNALPAIDDIEEQVLLALCGWRPPSGTDVIEVVQGLAPEPFEGAVFQQIIFQTTRELRI